MLTTGQESGGRIGAIDALRGFAVIVWICSTLALSLLYSFPRSRGADLAVKELTHSIWHGMTLFDLVFPAFLTAMGASIVLSNAKRVDSGNSTFRRTWRIVRRGAVLFLIGLLCTADFRLPMSEMRWVGPIQRIALCYVVATVVHLLVGWRGAVLAIVMLLGNYWAALMLNEIPGQPGSSYSMNGNFAAHVDRLYLPGRAYFGTWDPEGMLTTIPALAMTLVGVLIGHCLSATTRKTSHKLLILAVPALIAVINGFLLQDVVPINGYLWTPSFVLITCGLLSFLTAGMYWLVDVRGARIPVLPLLVAGQNSLALVIAASLLRPDAFLWEIPDRILRVTNGATPQGVFTFIQLTLIAGLAWFLYRKRLLLTV